jgi:hypothetical protein
MATRDPDAGPDRNPYEAADREGLPDAVQDLPPGKDIETAEEARMMPRDHSLASGSDPAYPVTAQEQRRPETPGDRKAREEPDFGEPRDAAGDIGGVFGSSPEESAVHEEES